MSEPPKPTGTVSGIIDSVLRFIDRPWKAVTVVVLIVILGVGWVLYEKRDVLLESWLTPSSPELRMNLIQDALARLIVETNADLVQIWEADLSTNSQRFIAARRHDGDRPVIPSPRRLPIIVHTSDMRRLVDLLEGRAICVDLSATGAPVVRRLAERGMKRGCAVPIPPSPESFVGIIYMAWVNPTDANNENIVVAAAREIATTLATH
jgi:uncharacterized membrane protein